MFKRFSRKKVDDEPLVDPVLPALNSERINKPAGQRQAHKRYAAAKSERLSRSVKGFGLSVDETIRRDVARLRAASRTAGEDVGYVKKYFGMVQTHVVGDKGFRLQSEAKTKSGKLDAQAIKSIELAWKAFQKLGVYEITGRMSGISADQLIAKTVSQDGDLLIRHIDGAPNKYGYSIQVLEADHLDINLYKTLGNGNFIKMGVEVDIHGRHIAYHILASHPGEYTWASNGKKYIRVLASEMILPFPMWRPGQSRGIPWAHAALLDMHDIAGFRESVAVGARVGASNMMLYERDPEFDADDVDSEFTEEGEFLQELDPGGSAVAPEGYKMRESKFDMPDASVGDFQKAILRGAASGMEANYNVLGNDYEGVSWSSLRQAILEDREHWKRMQSWFSSQIKTPIFERWLKNSLLKNAIPGLGAFDLDRVMDHTFSGRRWQWVDPLKDEQAVGEGYKNFSVNPMDVLNDKGIDLDQMAEGWTRYLEKMGPIIEMARKFGFGDNIKMPSMAENENTSKDKTSKED